MMFLPQSAPGFVQSLGVISMNVTSITISWDRVDCRERNGRIDGYRVVYYPKLCSNPNNRVARTLVGTRDTDRVFSINGLPPRISYTFEVQASNNYIDMYGPPAFYTTNTTAPQGRFTWSMQNNILLKKHFFIVRPWFSPGWSALS